MRVGPGRTGAGLRLALATLTVLPARARPDRDAAAVAMTAAPGVGLFLGITGGGVAVCAAQIGAPALVAAVLAVASVALLTRGLHLDGLADTADGLGSYTDATTALAIMRRPDIGPFGVIAVVLVLLAQVSGAAAALGRPWYAALAGVAAATAAGRVAIAVACRRGVPAARPDGMGALVAGTVTPLGATAGGLIVAAAALVAVPGRLWQGPVAVAVAVGAGALLTAHAVRRLGGITGDVLGAACEVTTAVTYVALSM